jgi:hypothetical protein
MDFTRELNLCNQIIILDGLTGTGKTMFAPLINSFERVQNSRFEYMIEYLCISSKKEKIKTDAASSMLNLLADIKYYDGAISREVNFRPSDLSSVFSGPYWYKYIKQLFMSDGEKAGFRLNRDNPILFFVTHQILSCIDPAIKAFGDRLKVVQMVRHPLYLVEHWESYIMMHGNNSRDFTLWIDYKGQPLPWFAEGWEEKYLSSNSYDKSIYSISSLMEQIFESKSNKKLENLMFFIPFELFVLNPWDYISRLESFLGSKATTNTSRILKSQHVPRKSINAGPQKNIYKRYALKKYFKNVSHEEDYNQKLNEIKSKCSKEAFDVLLSSNKKYENQFGLWF